MNHEKIFILFKTPRNDSVLNDDVTKVCFCFYQLRRSFFSPSKSQWNILRCAYSEVLIQVASHLLLLIGGHESGRFFKCEINFQDKEMRRNASKFLEKEKFSFNAIERRIKLQEAFYYI